MNAESCTFFAKVWNRVLELYDWKCVIGGLGRGWNPMQGLSLCTRLNDRVYINMKSIQLPLMELSGVIVYPVIPGLWVHPPPDYSAISFSLCSCISLFASDLYPSNDQFNPIGDNSAYKHGTSSNHSSNSLALLSLQHVSRSVVRVPLNEAVPEFICWHCCADRERRYQLIEHKRTWWFIINKDAG